MNGQWLNAGALHYFPTADNKSLCGRKGISGATQPKFRTYAEKRTGRARQMGGALGPKCKECIRLHAEAWACGATSGNSGTKAGGAIQ